MFALAARARHIDSTALAVPTAESKETLLCAGNTLQSALEAAHRIVIAHAHAVGAAAPTRLGLLSTRPPMSR